VFLFYHTTEQAGERNHRKLEVDGRLMAVTNWTPDLTSETFLVLRPSGAKNRTTAISSVCIWPTFLHESRYAVPGEAPF
jgi:hypothetical protein